MPKSGQKLIPFNKPHVVGSEIKYIQELLLRGKFSGDGYYTKKCHETINSQTGVRHSLLTHSCTAALEMAALLIEIQPGDEVIMPSYTFVSTANAFVLRGGIPVFIDIRGDNLNMDESKIEAAITRKTRAIVPVHYGGVGCSMDKIKLVASRHNLIVIEDAAQAVMAKHNNIALGAIGDLGAYSFHETKNISAGEGGALLIQNERYLERAEIIREKGTNRSRFFRGETDKYTWVDIGSSYLPAEIVAAVLLAQLEEAESITKSRLKVWNKYHRAFEAPERDGLITRPFIPNECSHNGHIYYFLVKNLKQRTQFIEDMRHLGIQCAFHYVPLHNTEFGRNVGRTSGDLTVTTDVSDRIIRLPMWVGIESLQDLVINECLGWIYKHLR